MSTATRPIVTQPPPDVVQTPAAYGIQIVPFEMASPQLYFVPPVPLAPYEQQSKHRPAHLLLGTLSDLGFRVLKPIPVNLEARKDAIVASWQEIDEFGTGSSTSSSAEDLGHTVAELYRSLGSEQDKLGPDLQRVWAKLQEYIVPRR